MMYQVHLGFLELLELQFHLVFLEFLLHLEFLELLERQFLLLDR